MFFFACAISVITNIICHSERRVCSRWGNVSKHSSGSTEEEGDRLQEGYGSEGSNVSKIIKQLAPHWAVILNYYFAKETEAFHVLPIRKLPLLAVMREMRSSSCLSGVCFTRFAFPATKVTVGSAVININSCS
jgi:hypothetical protein